MKSNYSFVVIVTTVENELGVGLDHIYTRESNYEESTVTDRINVLNAIRNEIDKREESIINQTENILDDNIVFELDHECTTHESAYNEGYESELEYRLHHAPVNLGLRDIPCLKFKTEKELEGYLDAAIGGKTGRVIYLLSSDHFEYITESGEDIMYLFEHYADPYTDIFLQEYESYQAAYEVALAMKEDNPLCFESER